MQAPEEQEKASQVWHEATAERLANLEDRIVIGETPSEEIFAMFAEEASNSTYCQNARGAIKEVTGVDNYFKVFPDEYAGAYGSRGFEREAIMKAKRQKIAEKFADQTYPIYFGWIGIVRRGNYRSQPFESYEAAEQATNDMVTARQFDRIYSERAGAAEDIDGFKKALTVACDPTLTAHSREVLDDYSQSSSFEFKLTTQTIDFMKKHPEDAEEAFRFWEERMVAGIEQGLYKSEIAGNYRYFPYDHEYNAVVDGTTFEFKQPIFVAQVERRREASKPKSFSRIISALSMPKLQANQQTVELADRVLTELRDKPPQGMGVLMQVGADVLKRYAEFANGKSPEASLIAQHIAKNPSISFNQVTLLANAVTPKLEADIASKVAEAQAVRELPEGQQAEAGGLRKLDPANIGDFGPAIERINYFIRSSIDEETLTPFEEDTMDKVALVAEECATLGANRKLEQHVTTLYELVMKFPGADPRELRDLAETMQTSGSLPDARDHYEHIRNARRMRRQNRAAGWSLPEGALN